MLEAWEMTREEERYLRALPEIVDLWHVRPVDSGEEGIFYLSEESGMDGARAAAHTWIAAEVVRAAVRYEYVLAVDLESERALCRFD